MRSFDHEHLRSGERASAPARPTRPTTTMSGAWIRHLQRVADGGDRSSSPGAGRETEGTDRSQVQRAAVDEGMRSSARPLDPALRGEMEQRFGGADFGGVQVHDGPVARRAAAAVGARAFTSGAHIVDGGGMSRKDWAHELAHTLDQAAGPVPGTDNGAGLRISNPGDEGERRAVATADQVMGAVAPVQRLAADQPGAHGHPHAGPTTVQRTRQSATAGESAAEQAGQSEGAGPSGQRVEGAEVIARLSQSIEQYTVQSKMKKNVFAPGTWWPEQWMVEGPARLRKTLDRRVMRGAVFNDQDLADIRHLSQVNAQWLEEVGIGTYEQAETYTKGRFDTWLTLPAGKRVLTATLAVRAGHPDVREAGRATPISPDYTLGRFMLTQAPGTSPEERQGLERERDQQIRDTVVDTLHPAGIAPERLHPDGVPEVPPATAKAKGKGKATESGFGEQDDRAREMLTKVLLILRNGLKLYDPAAEAHVVDHEKDVVRALAHGGRVNIRIPALSSADDPAYALPHFLGVTQDDRTDTRAGDVIDRGFATHRTSIGANKQDKPGTFKEKGGLLASVTNVVSVGAASPDLWGQNISGGGLGSKDWNGDVVLPNGSYGHMLLVHHRPTTRKDGSLQIGIETLAPHARSPVGYRHDFRSSEATANPESVAHGHKGDKVGSGGLGKNERMVDLAEMGKAHASGDWLTFLGEIKKQWDAALAETEDGSAARRALYEGLVGPRDRPES
ncbi:eCIS core domain-containing protein [Streptomyces brasiliscabiei]|uniref:eCIS core domain-containing protein n=1 Tax=Streptomyces brasiliscabiei TaxID=2736302 RepID=UPI001C11D412